jgi:uncharacterized protein (TIGR03437 family)
MRRSAVLYAALWFVTAPVFPRQEISICGTSRQTLKQQLHLHRQSLRLRKAMGLKVAPRQAAQAAKDIGNITVLSDADGVISRQNPFNLANNTVTFTPSAADASRYTYSVGGPAYDSAAALDGTLLEGLSDDDARLVGLPFTFPFFGAKYQQVFVNSDGNLTFVEADKASTDRSLGRVAAGAPRIAPLFTDLDPSRSPQGVVMLADSSRAVLTWLQVPEFADSGPGLQQTFQVRLYPDGHIDFAYSTITVNEAVVGIAPGRSSGSTTLTDFLTDPSGEYSSTIAERFTDIREVDMASAAQKFYETHEDAYDYLVVFNRDTPAATGAVAYESTVRNNATGFGDYSIDVGLEFGSPSRLQAVMNMGPLSQYPTSPTDLVKGRNPTATRGTGDTPTTILAHEAGHRFLAYASIPDPDDPKGFPMLGNQNAHWRFSFNSDASLLEGNRIKDNGPSATPRFLTTGAVEHYSDLDQYLMGFRGADEVAPTFWVTGVPLTYVSRLPQVGATFSGNRRDVGVSELIQVLGRRTPDPTVSQRRFRFAFILITPDGVDPLPEEVQKLEGFRTSFESFFGHAASDRASADTLLRRALKLSLFPAAGMLQGGTATASLALETVSPTPLDVHLTSRNGLVSLPATVTIPAGATSATFNVLGIQAGTDDITAEPVNSAAGASAYETAFARVQVAQFASLQMQLVSGDKQLAVAGTPMPDAVVVLVTDVNRLPYPGVRIQAKTSADGTVSADALTDASGQASFHWTPGAAPGQQVRFTIAGAPPDVGVTAVAITNDIRPAAVVNAASFTPTIAPASFGTIYGTSLANGANGAVNGLPWPDILAGVQVFIDGLAAQILYVSDVQINFLAPAGIPLGTSELQIVNPAGPSPKIQVNVAEIAPGLFFDPATNQGAILNAGTSVTTAQRPAAAGEFVEIYCTGLGPVRPSTDGLKQTPTPVVQIGSLPAKVVYSGLASGYTGLYQVNVQIPDGVPAGNQPLTLTLNGVTSNSVNIGIR